MACVERIDQELIAQVRAGIVEAQGELFKRHFPAVLLRAKRINRCPQQAEDLTSESFYNVISAIQNGNGPEKYFRTYLDATVKHLTYRLWIQEKRQVYLNEFLYEVGGVKPDDQVLREFELKAIREAFGSLPETLKNVLWLSEVRGMKPAEYSLLIDLSPNAAAALAVRAREKLLQNYMQQHLLPASNSRCDAVVQKLSAYARGKLSPNYRAAIEKHLAACHSCAEKHEELKKF